MNYIVVAAAFVVVLISGVSGWLIRGVQADRDIAVLKSQHDEQVSQAAQKYAEALGEVRKLEAARVETVKKEAQDANKLADAARVSAGRADDVARRLREHIPRLVSAAGPTSSDPAAPEGSSTVEGAGLVLTRLFDRSDAQLRSCAAALDQSIIAGRTCERLYDALSPPSNLPPTTVD